MKELIKKILNKLVDLIFLPFECLYKFIKNSDNILYVIVRLILLIALLLFIIYMILAKPYRKIMSGFYFEKYSDVREARTAILKELPLAETSTKDYATFLKKIGAKCSEKNNNYTCNYKENMIFKKYYWTVTIKQTKNGKSLNVNKKTKKADIKGTAKDIKEKL